MKNLKTRKKSKKLHYFKFKLFFIRVKKRIVYNKCLLVNRKVYFVFYILLLELADLKILIQDIFYY